MRRANIATVLMMNISQSRPGFLTYSSFFFMLCDSLLMGKSKNVFENRLLFNYNLERFQIRAVMEALFLPKSVPLRS